jgi:hypothetical protein
MRELPRLTAAVVLGLALSVPAGQAFASTTVTRQYSDEFNVNQCNNNEIIHLQLQIQIVTQTNGEKVTNRVTLHGTGTGDQGNDYVVQQYSFELPESSRAKLHLVSKGSAPNETLILTVDSNGDTVSVQCNG